MEERVHEMISLKHKTRLDLVGGGLKTFVLNSMVA
jgi:hypothetical protein